MSRYKKEPFSDSDISQRRGELEQFLDWLLRQPDAKPDPAWKQRRLRMLQRKVNSLKKFNPMGPAEPLKSFIAWLEAEADEVRRGDAYRIGEGARPLRVITKGKLDDENERLYLAVCIARYLYPGKSAYEEVRARLAKQNDNRELGTLRQSVQRFVTRITTDKTQSTYESALKLYIQFRCLNLITEGQPPSPLELEVNTSDVILLQKVIESGKPTRKRSGKPNNGERSGRSSSPVV